MKKKFKLVKDKSSFQITWKAKSEWYASTKDKDRWSDIVEPEAFKNALSMYMLNPIVLLQHDMDKPIWIVEEAKIDDNGLYIKAKITENEDWVFSKLVNGVLRSFSIGYRVKDYEDRDIYNSDWEYAWSDFVIKELELYEISIVSVPMNPYALFKSMSDCFEKEEEAEETQEVVEDVSETVEESTEEKVEETVEETPVEEEIKECETTVEQMDEMIEANTEETTEEKVEENVEEEKVENSEEEVKEVEENVEETPIETVEENSNSNEEVEEWTNNNEWEEMVEETKCEDCENKEEAVKETEINDWADNQTENQESDMPKQLYIRTKYNMWKKTGY